MSYIEKSIGGKVRGLEFNQGSHIKFLKTIDPENYESTTAYALVYCGLWMNAYITGDRNFSSEIKFKDVCTWVDEMNEQDVLDIVSAYKETQNYKKLIASTEEVEDPDKKKLE